jgi:hypothetical protein
MRVSRRVDEHRGFVTINAAVAMVPPEVSSSMCVHDFESIAALRRALGATSPPNTITQEAFDADPGHLQRLVQLRGDTRAASVDLLDYAHDLRYTIIQQELFEYLLPVCLQAWRDDLYGAQDYGAFVEHFYPVLADRHVFDAQLTPSQTAVVADFMQRAILAEIDAQRGLAYRGSKARPYRWIRALTTYGTFLPDIESLWSAWWALTTIGRAVSSVQYISALMYPDEANPIFAPWTPDEGGGPPSLWEFGGHLYSHRWLEQNVAFVKRALNVSQITDVLERAVNALEGEPEHEVAARMLVEIPEHTQMLAARCANLPDLLATTQEATTLLKWSV